MLRPSTFAFPSGKATCEPFTCVLPFTVRTVGVGAASSPGTLLPQSCWSSAHFAGTVLAASTLGNFLAVSLGSYCAHLQDDEHGIQRTQSLLQGLVASMLQSQDFEGIKVPVVQTVKNLPVMQETWVRSLGQEDPLEKGRTLLCSCLENSMDRGTQQATVHGVLKSWTRLSD